MMRKLKLAKATTLALMLYMVASATAVSAAEDRWGLDEIGPQLQSIGPMAFGPDGILLVSDPKNACVLAIQTEPSKNGDQIIQDLTVNDVTGIVAEKLSKDRSAIQINDVAVGPGGGSVFLAVQVTDGDSSEGQVWTTSGEELQRVQMDKLKYAKLSMPNPPEDKMSGEGRRRRNPREESITGLTYSDGRILVSGLSADSSPSSVYEFQFPFSEVDSATKVEIFHAAHGRYEDNAAIRTFTTLNIGGQPTLLAGYTCTPLVKLPLSELASASGDIAKVRGTTVAELGNWNRPLDMLVYSQGDQTYVLMSNSARGMMRISTEGIDTNEGLTEPVKGGGSAGQAFESIKSMEKVTKMDQLGGGKLVALVQADEQTVNLNIFELP